MAETDKGIYYPTFAEVENENYDGPDRMKMMAESIDPLLPTTAEKTKLEGIEAGAEVNAIETVKVNGTALTPSSKAVDVPVPTKTSDLTNDSGFIDRDVDNLENYYDKNAVDTKISSVYKYKGTVSTYNDLPSSNLTVGDVYNIETADSSHGVKAGDNVAWTGTTWDVLAGTVDLSGKEDKSNKVTSINAESTDTQYPSAKLLYDQLVEKQAEIDGLVEENSTLKKQFPTAHISTTSTQLTDSADGMTIENVKLKGATEQVQYEGRNIMPRILDDEFSAYGITVKIKDNVITIQGTTDGTNNFSHNFAFETPFVSPNENFYFHERNSATYNSITVGARYNDYTSDAAILNPINRILQSSNPGKIANYFNIYVASSQGTVNVTLQPSYELTNNVTDFEPYVRTDKPHQILITHKIFTLLLERIVRRWRIGI